MHPSASSPYIPPGVRTYVVGHVIRNGGRIIGVDTIGLDSRGRQRVCGASALLPADDGLFGHGSEIRQHLAALAEIETSRARINLGDQHVHPGVLAQLPEHRWDDLRQTPASRLSRRRGMIDLTSDPTGSRIHLRHTGSVFAPNPYDAATVDGLWRLDEPDQPALCLNPLPLGECAFNTAYIVDWWAGRPLDPAERTGMRSRRRQALSPADDPSAGDGQPLMCADCIGQLLSCPPLPLGLDGSPLPEHPDLAVFQIADLIVDPHAQTTARLTEGSAA